MAYKLVIRSGDGKKMYYHNGRLVKKASIPPHILSNLDPEEQKVSNMEDLSAEGVDIIDDSPKSFRPSLEPVENPNPIASPPEVKIEPPQDVCIFCGQPATRKRFVNMQTVALCEDDYNNKTTGETVAAMREFIQTKA